MRKPLFWIGSSRDDLREFPEDVRHEAGFTLHLAQKGDKALNAVPMMGFGSAKVLEVVIDNAGNTYRAVYTVKFARAVYVCTPSRRNPARGSQRQNPTWISSIAVSLRPSKTISHALIKLRNTTKGARTMAKRNDDDDIVVHESAGNVFADLGLPHAREDMLKVEIAHAISAAIHKKGLTQTAAGEIIGVDQAKVSALLRGRLSGFSVERLIVFLIKLGRDVDIMISRVHRNREGTVRVKSAA